MKKLLLSAVICGAMIAGGCQSNKSEEAEKPEKKEIPEVVTITNIGTLSFEEVDLNEDGRFTYDEFDKLTKNEGKAEGNTVYAEYDVDGNGIISADEFKGK